MDFMESRRGNVVAVPVRDQSEIFEKRRKNRRKRINSVHAEVRSILQVNSNTVGKTACTENNSLRKTN